jgi:DNA mismatch repair protein MutS
VREGAADRSYGVQVAKLAGLPERVITRAQTVLDALEKGEREGGDRKAVIDDLPLFAAAQPAPAKSTGPSPVVQRLDAIHPDEMTAREALQILYELKDLAARS